jgi:hypothetical protein
VPEPGDPRFEDVLSQAHVEALRALGRTRRFPVGAALFHEREPGESVLVLTSGRVKLSCVTESGREALLGIREPGELIGEMSAIDGGPRSATATALEPVEVIAVSREAFTAYVERTPGVGLVLARTVACATPTASASSTSLRTPSVASARGSSSWPSASARPRPTASTSSSRSPRRTSPGGRAHRARRSSAPCAPCASWAGSRRAGAASRCSTSSSCAAARFECLRDARRRGRARSPRRWRAAAAPACGAAWPR